MTDIRRTTPHTKWGRVILLAVGAAIAVGVVVLAFLWPSVTSSAKDFPLAVTGPSAQVSQIEKALSKGDTFTITKVDSRADAVSGIRDRTYDGAIVLGGDAPEVLTASASSPVTTQIMTGVQSQLQKQVDSQIIAGANAKIAAMQQAAAAAAQAAAHGQAPQTAAGAQAPTGSQAAQGAATIPTIDVKLTDIVPLADSDPRGAGISAAAFPFTIGGLIGGIVISLLVSGTSRRLTAVSLYAVIVGVIVVSIMQPWLGVLQGPFLLNVLAAALAFFATGVFIVGTTSLLGPVGVGVGSVLTMLVGNPISSATAPVQFLPGAWGAIGQWFVPGASATLLRDQSYFPDTSTAQSWLALGAWALLGIVLSVFGHFRNRELVHPEGWDEEDAVSSTTARHAASEKPVEAGVLVAAVAAVATPTS